MLHFTESGTGPAVVLLHAFPLDNTLWHAQRTALAAEGFRVVTPDLPGFGGSAISNAVPAMDVMADEVGELLAQLGIDEAVVGGLSMGGYVALAMLRRHPDRVRSLVLADTKASADAPEAAEHRESVARSVEASRTTADLAEAMLPNLLGATTMQRRPDVVAKVRRWIRAQPADGVAWAQRAMAGRPDSFADLGAFGGPVLVVRGAEDSLSSEADVQRMVDAAGSGGSATTIVTIPAAGHLTAVEDPQRVSQALLAWLTAHR